MKLTTKLPTSSSFHNIIIKTTVNELVRVLGEPTYQSNTGTDKVNFEWVCERANGDIIIIYDWKEYRPLDRDEQIIFHLGGYSQLSTFNAKEDLIALLNK